MGKRAREETCCDRGEAGCCDKLPRDVDDWVESLLHAQALEEADEVEEAVEVYQGLLAECSAERLGPVPVGAQLLEVPAPPKAVVASVAANCLSGIFLEATGGDTARQAVALAVKALRWWPANSMAKVNLATLEQKRGNFERCAELLRDVLATDPIKAEGSAEPIPDWLQAWAEEPRQECTDLAAYMLAVAEHQAGNFDVALPLLQRFGFRFRIAPQVWRAGQGSLPDAELKASVKLATDPEVPVRMVAHALPAELHQNLCDAFAPESPFWEETDYQDRGYFSFWYDVSKKPSNLVELAVQSELLALTNRDDIVGAEWWVHTRPSGRNMGHQLHYDTEENALQRGEIVHPVVSSVVYLTGADNGAGSTVVFDQDVHDKGPATQAVVARPTDAAMLLFPGKALHGVLPGHREAQPGRSDAAEPHRLTLLIGFWNRDVHKDGPRSRLGPCSIFPRASRATPWPAFLDVPAVSASAAPASPQPERGPLPALGVVAPAWEAVPSAAADSDSSEPPEGLDRRFFVRDFGGFAVDLLRTHGAEEGAEEGDCE